MRFRRPRRLLLVLFLCIACLAMAGGWRLLAAGPNKIDADALRVLINFAAGENGADASSENNQQFRTWLKQFPAADANVDNVLTQPEALAFVDLIDKMQNIEVRRNVIYRRVADETLKLDIYLPSGFGAEAKQRYPSVLYIHGGGWARGSKNNTPELMRLLAARGYVVASINYRLAPKHKFPAQIEDAQAAFSWWAEQADAYHLDPQRIAVMGGSAGGHLSLLVGLMDAARAGDGQLAPRPRAIVNIFGPTDLTTGEWSQNANSLIVQFLGGTLKEQPKAYQQASPISFIDRDDPPVLTLHGTKDPLVPFSQAERLHKALTTAGVSSQLEPIEGAGHGWGEPHLSRSMRLTLEFLDENVKGK